MDAKAESFFENYRLKEAKMKKNDDEKKPPKKGKIEWKKINWWAVLAIIAVVALLLSYAYRAQEAKLATSAAPTPFSGQTNVDQAVSEDTVLTFGDLGTYKCVYDTNRDQWTIGQWTENQVIAGKMTLADLKRDGGNISFVMPANGWINISAGQLFVDGKQWDLGNYGEIDRMTQNTLIRKNQIVSVEYGPENDSAGFQIWFQK